MFKDRIRSATPTQLHVFIFSGLSGREGPVLTGGQVDLTAAHSAHYAPHALFTMHWSEAQRISRSSAHRGFLLPVNSKREDVRVVQF